ncbi:MAG: DUF4956 domain-containing protein [Lachnospiraceae bacterium]
MLESIFTNNASAMEITLTQLLLMVGVSLAIGIVIALVHMFRNTYSKNFVLTIAMLPILVAATIMVVNGNLGAGITVAGAFSLVRFRSAPGNAREITTIFFAMATGLAVGMGYLVFAGLFTVLVSIAIILYTLLKFGEIDKSMKSFRIIVPEDTDYMRVFEDVMVKFTDMHRMERVKTTDLGSLLEVTFTVQEKNPYREKEFLDALRTLNANLPIVVQHGSNGRDEL